MNKLLKILVLAGLGVLVVSSTKADGSSDRAEREVHMGERAIMYSLATGSRRLIDPTSGRPVENWGVEQGELGLALIANKHGTDGSKALIGLMRFKLDGALSEDYHCYVAERGKRVYSLVESVDPRSVTSQCSQDVRKIAPLNIDPEANSKICRTADEVQAARDDILSMLKTKKKCTSSDF